MLLFLLFREPWIRHLRELVFPAHNGPSLRLHILNTNLLLHPFPEFDEPDAAEER